VSLGGGVLLVRFRQKPDNSNSHEFELHRPSNKGTKLLLKVIKAIIIIGRTAGRATRPEWIYSQGFYYPPRAGGEVWIFGFYNKKLEQTNKQKNRQSQGVCVPVRSYRMRMEREFMRILDRGVGKGTRPLLIFFHFFLIFFGRIARKSEEVFVRIFVSFFRCFGLPKVSVLRSKNEHFWMDSLRYHDPDSSPVLW